MLTSITFLQNTIFSKTNFKDLVKRAAFLYFIFIIYYILYFIFSIYIFATLFNVWSERRPLSSRICFCMKSVAIFFVWLKCIKKIWPHTDMSLEKKYLVGPLIEF